MIDDVQGLSEGVKSRLVKETGPSGRSKYWLDSVDSGIRLYMGRKKEMRGMLYRVKGSDAAMIAECFEVYGHMNFSGKRCLDLGGNISGFGRLALMRGATSVDVFEPLPSNADMCDLNLSYWGGGRVHRAAVSTFDGEAEFIIPNSDNAFCAAHLETRSKRGNRGSRIKVEVRDFEKVLEEFRPQILKMDIEGAEHEIFRRYTIPDFVEEVVLEWHLMTDERRMSYDTLEPMRFDSAVWEVRFSRTWTIFGAENGGKEVHYVRKS